MKREKTIVGETGRAPSRERSNPAERAAIRADLRRQVIATLQRLPEQTRRVLMLRDIHGMKCEEIGRDLGIPLSSVRDYIHRGRKELRTDLRQVLADKAE